MKLKTYNDFINANIKSEDFSIGAKDAFDTYNNIISIFKSKTPLFTKPKAIHINELNLLYKNLCPNMEIYHPGVIDKIITPDILEQLGFSFINNHVELNATFNNNKIFYCIIFIVVMLFFVNKTKSVDYYYNNPNEAISKYKECVAEHINFTTNNYCLNSYYALKKLNGN